MALTDYANKIFKLIESHQKSAGLAKLYLKNVKEWLGWLRKGKEKFEKVRAHVSNI